MSYQLYNTTLPLSSLPTCVLSPSPWTRSGGPLGLARCGGKSDTTAPVGRSVSRPAGCLGRVGGDARRPPFKRGWRGVKRRRRWRAWSLSCRRSVPWGLKLSLDREASQGSLNGGTTRLAILTFRRVGTSVCCALCLGGRERSCGEGGERGGEGRKGFNRFAEPRSYGVPYPPQSTAGFQLISGRCFPSSDRLRLRAESFSSV